MWVLVLFGGTYADLNLRSTAILPSHLLAQRCMRVDLSRIRARKAKSRRYWPNTIVPKNKNRKLRDNHPREKIRCEEKSHLTVSPNELYTAKMKHRKRERKMSFFACLGRAILLSVAMETSGVNGVDDSSRTENSYSAVRNRLPHAGASFERSLQSNEGMGKIWDKTSRIAKFDMEALRLLHDADMMSMSLSSSNDSNDRSQTRPPAPEPTVKPIPTPIPTAAPGPTHAPQSTPSNRPDLNPEPSPHHVDCSEETIRHEYIFDRLRHITDPEILMDPSTPQGMAYNHLANADFGVTDHCTYSTLEQRYGLLTFYFATNGDNWINRSGWLGREQECFWYGVDCDDVDSANHVTRLLLRKFSHPFFPTSFQTSFPFFV